MKDHQPIEAITFLTCKGLPGQNQLARALKVPPRRINEIILGKRGITADTALRLADYFGNSAAFWMELQSRYELKKAKESRRQEWGKSKTDPYNFL